MDRDLVWVLVYDFLPKELLNTHTYKKEILFLSFILCHVYHRRKKKTTERNHFSTAVFFITKLLHIEITPNYLK